MDTSQYRTVAGGAFVGVGLVTILGFVTAEAVFPGYSAADQTISALGAARGTPASRAVFNSAMVVSGLLTVVGAYALHHVYGRRRLTGVVAVTGAVGFAGVGLFPSQTGLPHFVAAMVAFAGAGVSALEVGLTVRGPFRYVSAALGFLELLTLVAFIVLGGANPLGIGGLERWVAYLGLVWVTAFGGFCFPGESA